MTKKSQPYKTEADLCRDFIAAVDRRHRGKWTAYAETAGWDILLVRKADRFQIGIQAKLRFGVDVLNQAVDSGAPYSAAMCGPDCRAVLVPWREANGFDRLAGYVGITVIKMESDTGQYRVAQFRPDLPGINESWSGNEDWYECAPVQRESLPEYVPDVVAGSPSPTQLTFWKISAIKIAVTIEKRGFCTRHDFKHHRIDYRRWVAHGAEWLRLENGKYVPGRYFPDFKKQHPRVYDEVTADWDKWKSQEPMA